MSKSARRKSLLPEVSSLAGQFLIAMPGMTDKRFQRTVIYLCVHSEDTAMGIIINKLADNVSFSELLEHLELDALPEVDDEVHELADMHVHFGGPVETGRGFVLHSPDYQTRERTLVIDKSVCLTATVDILKAITKGKGPRRSLLALGYAGWSPGQLENEIMRNGWLHCEALPELVFSHNYEAMHGAALNTLGVDPRMLSGESGHA